MHVWFASTPLRKQYQPICDLLRGQDVIVVSRCFCAFLMWLQPLLQRAAPVLKALTCACCLLAADVIVRDKYSVFVGSVSLSVEGGWTWPHVWAAPRRKTVAPASVCAGFPGKKKKKKNKQYVESFAKMRSSRQGMLKPSYLWRQIILPLLHTWDQWVAEVRPANESGNEAGDWCGLHPSCSSTTSSGGFCCPCFRPFWGLLAVGRSVKVTVKRIPNFHFDREHIL